MSVSRATEALRADACMSVPAGWTPSGQLERREIRGGRYALTLHVGPYAELERAYKEVVVWDMAAPERRGAGECALRRGVSERRAHRSADRAQDRDLASLALRIAWTSDSGTSICVTSRSCQRDRLLVGLQIRDARRAHRQMPLEFDALVRRRSLSR